jgi:hypothetical protein
MERVANVKVNQLLAIIGRLTVEKEIMADQMAALSARIRELESKPAAPAEAPAVEEIIDADHATRQ